MDAVLSFIRHFTEETPRYVVIGEWVFAGDKQPVVADASLIYFSTRLGKLSGSGFTASIPLLRWLASRTDKKAVVNEKSAWLFICSNNVLKEGIVSNAVSRGHVLVVNERDEVLGWGMVTGAGITNKLDLGDYLRRER
ncbi:MAG: hypothetical protein ACMXYD_01190 [Candidatus Woesearchaeota archaeon]